MYVCIQNVCLYTWRHGVLLWQPYMMQTTVEVNCSRSIKSSNKLNRSAEPNSKLWFRHRASAMLLLNRSTTYELCLNLHKSSAPWLVTFWYPIVLLLPSLLWLAFRSASVWNARHSSLSCTSYSALHAYSGQVAGCFIDWLQIMEQFRPGKRLVLFDWCLLFYWSLADRGAVSCGESIGFVWLIFLVAHLCILYWLFALCADFVNGNSWFCLSDILTVILSVLVSVLVLGKCHVKKVAFSRSLLARCNCGQTCWKKAYSRGNGRYCFEITTFWLFIHFKEQYSTLIRCRKPSHSRTKGKSLVIIQIQGSLEKISNLKPLFSRSEELYVSKEVKEKMLLHQRANHADQKQWLRKINMRVITSQFEICSKNHIWSVKTFSPRA